MGVATVAALLLAWSAIVALCSFRPFLATWLAVMALVIGVVWRPLF